MNNKIKNPIIPGYNPDPSICRVGDDFYLACSSMELCPGIPIYHSKDLANWELIGYAMDENNGLYVEADVYMGGVMAPTIRYHEGTFYIMNFNVTESANYIVTATNPAGPWSKPYFLDDIPNIDASMFFDEDGKCYAIGTGMVVERADGSMERGIWVREFDIQQMKCIEEPSVIWDSALRGAASPESPHIYKVGEYYYLIIAEGGTGFNHAVTVARSKDLKGWYEGCPMNPIMSHRQLGKRYPITNAGHADLIQTQNGDWYAVLLASRNLEGAHKCFGRESYICPVIWEDGWPVFSPLNGRVEFEYPADENLPWTPVKSDKGRDDFDGDKLALCWTHWGTPFGEIWKLEDSCLKLKCLKRSITEPLRRARFGPREKVYDQCVNFIARRQVDVNFETSCSMKFVPNENESAGFAIMEACNHHFKVQRVCKNGEQLLELVLVTAQFDVLAFSPQFTSETTENVLVSVPWNDEVVDIRLVASGLDYCFYYGKDGQWNVLCEYVDARVMHPSRVSGLIGTMLGMFATGNGVDSDNVAAFDWFEYKNCF